MRRETIALAGMLAGGLIFAAVQASRAHDALPTAALADLSPAIGVSRERIRQIEVKALAKVSRAMCEGRAPHAASQ